MIRDTFGNSVNPSSSNEELEVASTILEDMGYRYTGVLEDTDNVYCFESDSAEKNCRYVMISIMSNIEQKSFLLHSEEFNSANFGEILLSQFIEQQSFSHEYKKGTAPKPE